MSPTVPGLGCEQEIPYGAMWLFICYMWCCWMLLVISCRPDDVLFILQTSAAWSVLTPIVRVSSGPRVLWIPSQWAPCLLWRWTGPAWGQQFVGTSGWYEDYNLTPCDPSCYSMVVVWSYHLSCHLHLPDDADYWLVWYIPSMWDFQWWVIITDHWQ